MKILEKHNYEFKAQLDPTNKLHSLKCELLEKDPDPYEPYLRIKKEHLKPLFDTDDFELMRGEYEDDTLYLSMTFKTEGTFFECAYFLDFKTGEVRFSMDKPLLVINDFVIPDEFGDDLKKRIGDLKQQGRSLESFNDEQLDLYFSNKCMGKFIDFAAYMENLINNNGCRECAFNHLFQLMGTCNKFYTKNMCQ